MRRTIKKNIYISFLNSIPNSPSRWPPRVQVQGLTRDKSYNTAAQPSLSEASSALRPENNGLSSLVPEHCCAHAPSNCGGARGSAQWLHSCKVSEILHVANREEKLCFAPRAAWFACGKRSRGTRSSRPCRPQSCLLHAGTAAVVEFEGERALWIKNAHIFQPQ